MKAETERFLREDEAEGKENRRNQVESGWFGRVWFRRRKGPQLKVKAGY